MQFLAYVFAIAKKVITCRRYRKKEAIWHLCVRTEMYPRREKATWKFLSRVQNSVWGGESSRKIRVIRHHYLHEPSCRLLKFQVLKCGPDKSYRQGPHLSIWTHEEVAYPLRTSILFPIPAFLFFSLFSCSALSYYTIPRSFLSISFSHHKRVSSSSRLLSFLLKTCSFLPHVKVDLGVSAPAAAEVPPLAITMKDGHWARGPDHFWQTHAWAAFVVSWESTKMMNIAMAPRHKVRISTANFYFDRRAINMLLRLVRQQITIYRWLLPRTFAVTYLFQFFSFPVSFAHDTFRQMMSLSCHFDSTAWHALFRPFKKILAYSFLTLYLY